jgi:hypothetical protein
VWHFLTNAFDELGLIGLGGIATVVILAAAQAAPTKGGPPRSIQQLVMGES